MLDGAFEIVSTILGFGWEGPRWLVAGADINTAEEDGVEPEAVLTRMYVLLDRVGRWRDGCKAEKVSDRRGFICTYSTSTPYCFRRVRCRLRYVIAK